MSQVGLQFDFPSPVESCHPVCKARDGLYLAHKTLLCNFVNSLFVNAFFPIQGIIEVFSHNLSKSLLNGQNSTWW